MNKAELSDRIADKLGLTKRQVEQILDTFEEVTIEALTKGDEVTLTGFGTFMAKNRHARMGVDPRNPTQKIHIPEVTIPKFKAGKALKDALKSGAHQQPKSDQSAS